MTESNQNVVALETETAFEIALPEPTGEHQVGTTSYSFVDPEREETYTEDGSDNRELTAKVWYPSERVLGTDSAPYLDEELVGAIASELEVPPEDFNNLIQSISTHSFTDTPLAESESDYPVLIFSHGFGDLPELNTIKAEELASQGYVVVGINHTYDSLANVFPDGTVVPSSTIFDEAESQSQLELIELLGESVDIRAEDVQFVLDQLEGIDAGDEPTNLLSGKLDLDRVGIYGYSLGGATAAKVLSLDSRFQAGINLDGGLFGDVAQASLSQPFMIQNNESFGTGNTDDPFELELNQVQQNFVDNLQNDGYEVTIAGTVHANFNDVPFLLSLLANAGIDLGEEAFPSDGNFEEIDPNLGFQIINDYTAAFFDRYLNDLDSPLLIGNSSPYPEVTFQSFIEEDTTASNSPESVFGTVDGDIFELDSANQLVFTGDDDDTVILGTGDRLIAGSGTDLIFTGSRGDNVVTGGAGADQFWIAVAQTPNAANIITDFDNTEDVIGIAGLGIGFNDLSITEQEADVLISANNSELAILQGINSDNLSADNFVFS